MYPFVLSPYTKNIVVVTRLFVSHSSHSEDTVSTSERNLDIARNVTHNWLTLVLNTVWITVREGTVSLTIFRVKSPLRSSSRAVLGANGGAIAAIEPIERRNEEENEERRRDGMEMN